MYMNKETIEFLDYLKNVKRFSNKKEVCINYTEDKKNITVKTK